MSLGAGLVALLTAVALPWWVPAIPATLTGLASSPAPPQAPLVKVVAPARDGLGPMLAWREPAPSYLPGTLPAAGRPIRVVVPRLGVDAAVVPISGQGGELVPPSDPRLLGWWREGAVPGAAHGSAVITGHTVHTGGGALDALGTLRRGDTFTVVTDQGEITYLVRWQHDYPTQELAQRSPRLFGQGDFARLLLITCSGWNGSGYDQNAVVLARPVGSARSASPVPGR